MGYFMSEMVNVNFRMERKDKIQMEKVCKELGLSMSTAFNIFAKKVGREYRIPFEVSEDKFYSKENIDYLRQQLKDYDEGKLKIITHDLEEM